MAKIVKVVFKKVSSADKVTVRIDDTKITLSGDGGSKKVEPGEHYLQWLGVAPPGVTCTIAITAPPESLWAKTFTVAADGLFGGSKKFRVNQR